MAQKLSQLYDVDNRYREAKGVPDNTSGKRFLQQFMEQDRRLGANIIGNSRQSDNRFVVAAQGGTVPIASIGLTGSLISNTDSRATFKNAFRATQSYLCLYQNLYLQLNMVEQSTSIQLQGVNILLIATLPVF